MILRDLCDLYDRCSTDEGMTVSPFGWSIVKVAYRLRIDEAGELRNVIPYVSGDADKKSETIPMQVPEQEGRTSAIKPFFLCDTGEYLLAAGGGKAEDKFNRSAELHKEVLACCDSALAHAVVAFFGRGPQRNRLIEMVEQEKDVQGKFCVFEFAPDNGGSGTLVHEDAAIQNAWYAYREKRLSKEEAPYGRCSVTGEYTRLANLFPQLTGVAGAQPAGASLVSFNDKAYESYGKTGTHNASISRDSAFKAGEALRYLARDGRHHTYVGDTLLLFWTDAPVDNRGSLWDLCMELGISGGKGELEDGEALDSLKEIISSVRAGASLMGYDLDTKYYLLGLAPNAARLSVRFYYVQSFGFLLRNCEQYLNDVSMDGVSSLPLKRMFAQTAALGKKENVPSTLVASTFRSLIAGARLPQSLFATTLSRMRADHASRNKYDLPQRAAIMKACLVRGHRVDGKVTDEELTMSLNESNANVGYVLGRLFALLERAQEASAPGLNATIRDKYIGSASATPARVFPQLLSNCQNHLSKLGKERPGQAVNLRKQIDAVIDMLDGEAGIPKTLSMDDQGMFYVAYHQQRYALWNKQKNDDDETEQGQ